MRGRNVTNEEAQRRPRMICIQQNEPPYPWIDATATYPSDHLPAPFTGLQPLVEAKDFVYMAIYLRNIRYRIIVSGTEEEGL